MKHKWKYCELCGHEVVICGLCGMNQCSGGQGEIDGKPCPECDGAYKVYMARGGDYPSLSERMRMRLQLFFNNRVRDKSSMDEGNSQ